MWSISSTMYKEAATTVNRLVRPLLKQILKVLLLSLQNRVLWSLCPSNDLRLHASLDRVMK